VTDHNARRTRPRLLLMLVSTAAVCLGSDPFVGTWRPAEFEKWKISPGGTAEERKSRMFSLESAGKDSYREIVTTLDGKTVISGPTIVGFDGSTRKDASKGITLKPERIDERHTRITAWGSKGTSFDDYVVSPDGQIQTITRKGNGASTGRSLDELFIYKKEPAKGR
jgi:hypothetical protein